MINDNKNIILKEIINILKKGDKSIADLQREIGIKRSTLIYYIQILESKGFIDKNRLENKVTGRPTIIKLDTKKLENYEKSQNKVIENANKDFLENHKKDFLKILTILKEEKSISLLEQHKKLGFPQTQFIIPMTIRGLINNNISISEKGLKFLEDNNNLE